MTLHQLTAALRSFFTTPDTFPAALAPTPFFEDDPRADAEFWLDFCQERYSIPLVRDPVARAMLEDAAKWHESTGLSGRYYEFQDGSKLSISDVMEAVL